MTRTFPMVFAAAAMLLASPAAQAEKRTPEAVVEAASQFLSDAQGWYQGRMLTDRGPKSVIVRNGWEWRRGEAKAAANITGVVASALLDAHLSSGDPELLEHALLYGMTLLNDFREFRSLTIPYRADIAFMARLSDFTGDPSYREAASAWFGNLKLVSPTGAAEVARMFGVRKGRGRTLVGYDIAFGIHAAIGVGDIKYAAQLADAVWARRAEWVARPKLRDPWDITSKAALISAFQALDADRYGPAIDQLAANLIALQSTDGSWGSHTQATAYSLEALTDIGGRKARSSSRRAALWLANSLGPEGGWPSNASDSGRNIEAQAEALSAYVAYLKTS